jgi:hypothetical protein
MSPSSEAKDPYLVRMTRDAWLCEDRAATCAPFTSCGSFAALKDDMQGQRSFLFTGSQDDMYEVGGDDGADASILSELSALNEV